MISEFPAYTFQKKLSRMRTELRPSICRQGSSGVSAAQQQNNLSLFGRNPVVNTKPSRRGQRGHRERSIQSGNRRKNSKRFPPLLLTATRCYTPGLTPRPRAWVTSGGLSALWITPCSVYKACQRYKTRLNIQHSFPAQLYHRWSSLK